MHKVNILVDLDGVLVDFMSVADAVLLKQVGYSFSQLDSSTAWFLISQYQQDIYKIAKPTSDYLELWQALKPYQPKILTAIPSLINLPHAKMHKKEWVKHYLGEEVQVKFGPHSIDKQNHCNPGDILIDDNHLNIKQWKEKGGIGILHINAKNTLTELKKYIA